MATETAAGLRYSSRTGRWVLAATVLGSGIAALDATVVGIALPAIGRDFHATVASMQWVINGYTLPLAGLLLLGGALGDVHGRRKVFIIGTVWFALASLACGVAPNVDFLIRGQNHYLEEGVAYEVSNLDYHAVTNRGPDRIHFIFDYTLQ